MRSHFKYVSTYELYSGQKLVFSWDVSNPPDNSILGTAVVDADDSIGHLDSWLGQHGARAAAVTRKRRQNQILIVGARRTLETQC